MTSSTTTLPQHWRAIFNNSWTLVAPLTDLSTQCSERGRLILSESARWDRSAQDRSRSGHQRRTVRGSVGAGRRLGCDDCGRQITHIGRGRSELHPELSRHHGVGLVKALHYFSVVIIL